MISEEEIKKLTIELVHDFLDISNAFIRLNQNTFEKNKSTVLVDVFINASIIFTCNLANSICIEHDFSKEEFKKICIDTFTKEFNNSFFGKINND